jgi:hypothetical protein
MPLFIRVRSDAEKNWGVKRYEDQILEELNVKSLIFLDDIEKAGTVMSYVLSPV